MQWVHAMVSTGGDLWCYSMHENICVYPGGTILHVTCAVPILHDSLHINNLRNSTIIFILREWQHGSLSEHNDFS